MRGHTEGRAHGAQGVNVARAARAARRKRHVRHVQRGPAGAGRAARFARGRACVRRGTGTAEAVARRGRGRRAGAGDGSADEGRPVARGPGRGRTSPSDRGPPPGTAGRGRSGGRGSVECGRSGAVGRVRRTVTAGQKLIELMVCAIESRNRWIDGAMPVDARKKPKSTATIAGPALIDPPRISTTRMIANSSTTDSEMATTHHTLRSVRSPGPGMQPLAPPPEPSCHQRGSRMPRVTHHRSRSPGAHPAAAAVNR